MPTYDYECKTCGHTFEVFQSMSEEPIKECPLCANEVRRLIGGGLGVIFKGNGFYVTDNKRDGTKKAPSKTEAKKDDATKTPTADVKPAVKDETKSKSSSPEKSSKTKTAV